MEKRGKIDVSDEIEADIDSTVTSVTNYIEKRYQESFISPKQYCDTLLFITEVYKVDREKKVLKEIGYDMCRGIKHEIEREMLRNPISMIEGIGYAAFSVHAFSCTTGLLNNFSSQLDEHLLDMAYGMATRYISNNEPTKVESYDCILGISGATYYLLDIFDVGNKKISTCLEYLINLTTLTEIDGKFVPKFHVKSSEQITKEAQEIFKNGNINFGVSHGMMGPLLTLSKALNMGWKVNGLNVGVRRLFDIYERYRISKGNISFWPGVLPLELYLNADYDYKWIHFPASWCYGNISIVRGLQKVAKVLKYKEKEEFYYNEMNKILSRNITELLLDSPALCHGYSGILMLRLIFLRDYKAEYDLDLLEENIRIIIEKFRKNSEIVKQEPNIIFKHTYRGKRIEGYMNDLSLLNGSVGIALTLQNVKTEQMIYNKLLMMD